MARKVRPESFEGCLVAVALGDSLGATMEGYRSHDLLIAYEEGRYDRWQMQVALWTDDTAMTVATAQSIIAAGKVDGEDLAKRYLAWYRTGGRGIGRATLRAMERLLNGVPWDQAGETGTWAAGNGVAMRIAPIGLFHSPNLRGLPDDVRTCGIITHRNEEAINAALAVAWVVARAAGGELKIDTLVPELIDYVPPCKTIDAIVKAEELARSKKKATQALPELGLGASAWQTVGSAFYCWLRNPDDLADVLTTAVLGAGDADTRAAIAGAMAGAYLGAEALPARWLQRLDGYKALVNLARRLYEVTCDFWGVKERKRG
ncbi:MAG: ADP-ribosylglycohydrolase family protein [Armatimonadetes bacterium]|nr:ADP-ribosylglycohydrolase family protein [Armatimonadota bacterium]